jgi:hypothetical protein
MCLYQIARRRHSAFYTVEYYFLVIHSFSGGKRSSALSETLLGDSMSKVKAKGQKDSSACLQFR